MSEKRRVLLEGPILTRSGYGEHCRFVFRALASKDQEVDLYISPTGWGGTSWIFGEKEKRQQEDTKKKKGQNKRSKNKTTGCTTKYTHPDSNITTKYRLVQLNYIY